MAIIRASSTQFARPTDTTAYAANELIANDVDAADVVPLQFPLNVKKGPLIAIDYVRMRKSSTGSTNPNFRLNLFKAAPTVATNGDNSAFTNVTGATNFIGSLTLGGAMTICANGGVGILIPFSNTSPLPQPLVIDTNEFSANDIVIFALLEALAAYAPGNAETFDFTMFARTLS